MRIAITPTASTRIQEAIISETPIIFSRVQLTGTGTYSTRDVHKPADGSNAGVSVLIDKNDVPGSPVFDTFNLFATLGTGSEFLFATTGVNIDFGGSEDRKIILTALLEITDSEQVIFEYSGGDDAYQVAVQQGFEGTAQDWLQSLIGPQGERGPQGPQGPKGDKGDQGIQGPKGDKGDQGIQGPKGDKGDTGDTGPRGLIGPEGPKGDTGPRGPQGEIGPEGPKGDKGDKGDQGIPGPEGPRGLPGEIEELHSAHIVDALGYLPLDPIDLTWSNVSGIPTSFPPSQHTHDSSEITNLPDLTGPKGDKGDKGDQGIPGPEGPKGDKGDTGDIGPRGPQGPKGDIGPEGPRGPQGLKGDKGDKGDQGIQGPEGPRGAPAELESLESTHVEDALGYLPLDPADLTWANISNKPSTFTPAAHSHSWAQITSKPSTFTPSSHTHTIANVTGLQNALDGKAGKTNATTSSSGLMSAADKSKLNGLSTDALTLQGRSPSNFMQVVNHGTNANVARPAAAVAVYWVGSAEPSYANNNDIWVGG